ncbi:hypothetical protein EXIGLDRAFT_837487 [Exidia glandulosa HHB12029]|uniref:DUF6533 domain-containing protein n=1 Tax=Exidia glandulosa HHB12029 TaxID=1314781 RepID=A0A165GRS7_EXIGL|nr:hypothetical protein EXIGLDRAFT_837487 [Exidia glandulosa HHB12029]
MDRLQHQDDLQPHISFETWFANVLSFEYVMLSALCLALYDWCITLDREIELVWQKTWNWVTLLWALIRYLPLGTFIVLEVVWFVPTGEQVYVGLSTWHLVIVIHAIRSCFHVGLLSGSLVILSLLLCHVAFALRTYALYQHDKRIRNLLAILLAVETALMVYVTFAGLHSPLSDDMEIHPHMELKVDGCLSTVPNNAYGILSCSIPFAFDSVIFAMTLARSISFLRTNVTAPVIPVLLRDGIGYFIVILACYLANTLLFIYGTGNAKVISMGYSIMFPVVLTLRLTINLRGLSPDPPAPLAPEDSKEEESDIYLTGLEDIHESIALTTHPFNPPSHNKSRLHDVESSAG